MSRLESHLEQVLGRTAPNW